MPKEDEPEQEAALVLSMVEALVPNLNFFHVKGPDASADADTTTARKDSSEEGDVSAGRGVIGVIIGGGGWDEGHGQLGSAGGRLGGPLSRFVLRRRRDRNTCGRRGRALWRWCAPKVAGWKHRSTQKGGFRRIGSYFDFTEKGFLPRFIDKAQLMIQPHPRRRLKLKTTRFKKEKYKKYVMGAQQHKLF